MAKIGITMDDELLSRLDQVADEQYSTRSGLITLCVLNYLNSIEVQKAFGKTSLALDRISKLGFIDKKTLQELEDIKRLLELVSIKK